MDEEDSFQLQLARTIQSWLWIESELYSLYATLMRGANPHLVSATFNNIQSVDAKLGLLNSCFVLVFAEDSEERKRWKTLFSKVEKLSKKRNKIVHEPVSVLVSKGKGTISLGPSYFNALALVKGQTTHKKGAVVSAEYDPRNTKLLREHRLDLHDLAALEHTFERALLGPSESYRRDVRPEALAAVSTGLHWLCQAKA